MPNPPPPLPNRWDLPNLGLGLGLRGPHIRHVLEQHPAVDWFEVITDNHLIHQGWLRGVLDRLRERYPVVLHGVTLNLGSTDRLDLDYLRRIKDLAREIEAPWVSDHVCWTGVDGVQTHDLLPVPYSEPMLAWMVQRVRQVQDVLERPLILENPSSYVQFRATTMPEWQFVRRLCDEADCGLLLDVNNVYVASVNHEFDPHEYLAAMPWDRVTQLHLAGHTTRATHLFDSHIGPVAEPVWQLYREAWQRTAGRATLYEWDDEVPEFQVLLAEASQARDRVADLHIGTPAAVPALLPKSTPQDLREPPAEVLALLRWMQAEVVMGQGASGVAAGQHLHPTDRMTADERVEIHRSMYRARTAEALRTDFADTARLLGNRFEALVVEFRQTHRSTSWALEQFGQPFAEFVRQRVRRPAWAAEVARLEWLAIEAWLAPLAPALDVQAVAAIPAEDQPRMVLEFAPSLRTTAVSPAALRWRYGPEQPRGRHVAIWAHAGAPQHRICGSVEAHLIETLRAGTPLGLALDEVGARSRTARLTLAREVGAWFQAWAQGGLVTNVRLAAP